MIPERAKRLGKLIACFKSNRGIRPFVLGKLGGYEHIWSVRITEQYRAVGERHGDTITWVWIGTHNEFDKLFG